MFLLFDPFNKSVFFSHQQILLNNFTAMDIGNNPIGKAVLEIGFQIPAV